MQHEKMIATMAAIDEKAQQLSGGVPLGRARRLQELTLKRDAAALCAIWACGAMTSPTPAGLWHLTTKGFDQKQATVGP